MLLASPLPSILSWCGMFIIMLEWYRNIPLEPGKNPLFSTMFNLNNFTVRPVEAAAAELQVSPYPYEWDFCEYDIYVSAQELDRSFVVQFDYRTGLFERTAIEQLAAHYARLVEQIAAAPTAPVKELAYINICRDSVLH
ncbi:condensation domain-containing protein [Paenibacillus thiaminolyticus]